MKINTAVIAGALASALALGMPAAPAQAQTIASKIELLGAPASLEFTGLRMRDQNGLLNVQAEVTNRDNRPHTAYYRVKWMDETGFQVWDDEPWKPLLINGEQKLTLQIVSPTTKARDFTIQFSATINKSLSTSDAPYMGR
ncbi:putative periplasmic lipoprotein [Herbaspirillum sp. CF444]|uniref:YcfL family protein n=1 Tax=Herbaspirillum sp. CF444 TaxID=1144319 RepID=UPI0002726929|nr:YcfL family protein [Herbaspirillum sp. CF444]EJL84128.1 putative periplasmic lipoprotein [Herbaspirillum sp. CF444]